jgi:hypothetical protein
MSSKTWSRDCFSGTIDGARIPVQSAIADSTSRRLTAQTSHCTCVTMCVGASSRSSSASTRYTLMSCSSTVPMRA